MNCKASIISLLLIFTLGCKQHEPKGIDFQSTLDLFLQENPNLKGIMAHVEGPDSTLSWSGAAGYADWEEASAIEPNQPALIASITKTYMSVAILRLVEQGELQLNQNLEGLLSTRTDSIMRNFNFELGAITIAQLLSHKSGIPGYVGSDLFLHRLINEPNYRWTRDEQITLALKQGPQNRPGNSFKYTDTNYLLLGEILEQKTGMPFYEAIRALINYDKLGLKHTWFYTLDSIPINNKALIHQYVPANNEDSYEIDNSFDLYGGGGIATTTSDLAKFIQALFNGDVFEQDSTLNLLFTDVKSLEGDVHEDYIDGIPCEYYLGIQACGFDNLNAYWHKGYWGTIYRYFPALNTTVVLFVVNQNEFEQIEVPFMKAITKQIQSSPAK